MNRLARLWFPLGLTSACAVGYLYPETGSWFYPWIPHLVALVLFLMGIGQPLAELWRSLHHGWAIAFTLSNNFALAPAFSFLAGWALFPADPALIVGMVILGAAPTTIASSIVWTRTCNGNTALALVLTLSSTLASVLFMPLIMGLFVGGRIQLPLRQMILTLTLVILAPVLLAQAVRHFMPRTRSLDRYSPGLGHAIILIMILTAVSRSGDVLTLESIVRILTAVVAIHSAISLFSYGTFRRLGFSRDDSVAVLFASSQKAITIGLLVGLLYFEPRAGLPILVYHLYQQLGSYAWALFLRGDSSVQPGRR